MSKIIRNRQYITDKILKVRQDVCKLITEKMTVKQAYEKLGLTNIVYNSFYQQCMALIDLGYLKDCGYHKVGKTRSVIIVSIHSDYVYNMHHRIEAPQVQEEKPVIASGPRIIKLTDTEHWYSEKKKSSKVHASGGSLNMVMATANY